MKRKRLTWQLYTIFLVLLVTALTGVTLYTVRLSQRFFVDRSAAFLDNATSIVVNQLAEPLPEAAEVDRLCKEIGRSNTIRFTVLLPSGQVVGDSQEEPAQVGNQADRSEISDALAGRTGTSLRFNHVLRKEVLFVAHPVVRAGKTTVIVRSSLPLDALQKDFWALYTHVAIVALAAIFLVAIGGAFLVRRLSHPLEEIQQGVLRFAHGDLSSRLAVSSFEEVGSLAEAMNQMAGFLDDRIRTVTQQKGEQEAVLASMVEGVLAVDRQERILNLNQAAADLLGVSALEAKGRLIQEMIRNVDLQNFIALALSSRDPVDSDIVIQGNDELHLQAHGTVLRDSQSNAIGALIVLHDITRLRHLENLRKEFVANVSHELKTPITSIKGFVETLLDGASENPEDTKRFLTIISKQVERLNAIIEDLLALSRIEKESERSEIALREGSLREVLQAAITLCDSKAREKKVTLHLQAAANLSAPMNPELLEQAVVNLIDNAVKYSDPGDTVEIQTELSANHVLIQVRDQGCGIEEEHLPRLFERFYRVDKARSRKLGGTGLGLSIVKHIAQAHGGRVSVASTPGKGSTFTIQLPLPS